MTSVNVDTLLMRYAAGALSPYESMLMAAYLAVNPQARQRLRVFEAAGGQFIECEEQVSVSQTCLNNVLAVTQADHAASYGCNEPCGECDQPAERDINALPAPIRKLIKAYCPQVLCWEALAPGVAKVDISLCRSEPHNRRLLFLRLAPRQMTPMHRHRGVEMTLVLEGSFHDQTGTYRQGDFVVIDDASLRHSPQAGEEGCLCLVLIEAPLKFRNPLIHLAEMWRSL